MRNICYPGGMPPCRGFAVAKLCLLLFAACDPARIVHGGETDTSGSGDGMLGRCGNGICDAGEVCSACPVDCGSCPVTGCTPLPPALVDTTYPATTGNTITVGSGSDLQQAIDQAELGDEIVLEAGATFTGSFTLPEKTTGEGWLVIRTANLAGIPAAGTRVNPAIHGPAMARLRTASNGVAVLQTAARAHHYRLVGIDFGISAGHDQIYGLVGFGNDESVADLPHHLILDRCWLRANATGNARRGVALNSGEAAVIDSYLEEFKEVGADSQAIGGWHGTGPYKIVNNFLEGAGENFMLGGADTTLPGNVPSDIEFRNNHLFKRLSWHAAEPSYGGVAYVVKNLFELKNARRVLIEGNVLEHSWAMAQRGFAFVLTPRNQGGTNPWATVEDVTIRYNIIRHAAGGTNLLSQDNTWPSGSGSSNRIHVHDNLFDDIGGTAWLDNAPLFQFIHGGPNAMTCVVVEHNTGFSVGNLGMIGDAFPVARDFVFSNNLALTGAYGFFGSGAGTGTAALDFYMDGYTFAGNVIIGGDSGTYPVGNFFPAAVGDVGFVDYATGDYRLDSASPYLGVAAGGGNPGADLDAVEAFTLGVVP